MRTASDVNGEAAGMAALSICESLLLALSDLKVMSEKDIDDVLQDVAEIHRNAAQLVGDAPVHLKVAAIVERIRSGVGH